MERETIICRFQEGIELMSPPSADSLKEFCSNQNRYTPNIPFPTTGGKTAWNTLADWWGWRVQENKLTGHIRILDPGGIRQAWGAAEQVLPALLAHIRERDRRGALKYLSFWGIVFCGGGAKGAYQIGVWKRLRELGFEERIRGVSGASVGALNSLLFAQGDLELARDVWKDIRQEDITRQGPAFKTLFRTTGVMAGAKAAASALAGIPASWSGLALETAVKLGRPYLLAGGVISAGAMAYALNEWSAKAGLYSREFLEDMIENKISPEKIRRTNKLVYSSLAALSLPHPIEEGEELQGVFCNAEYHCWQGLSFLEIKKRVLASAALPAAYAPMRLNGKVYVDGGVIDNFPVRPLAEAGFSPILVIHLSNPIEVRKRAEVRKKIESAAGDSKIIHIWPSRSVGGTLEINRELTRERMALGYADACAQLEAYIQLAPFSSNFTDSP